MISWDNFHDDPATETAPAKRTNQPPQEPQAPQRAAATPAAAAAPAAAAPAPAPQAPDSAPAEPTQFASSSAPQTSTQDPAAQSVNERVMAQAEAELADLDITPGLEELGEWTERVTVDDKRMINCRADLNQLVPFK